YDFDFFFAERHTTSSTFEITTSLPFTSVDNTPPVITPTVQGTLGNNGWYTDDTHVSWSVTDPESAVTSTSGCGDASVTSDTTGTDFTCSATSAGGTASQTVTIKRDTQPPTISGSTTPAPNAAGWNNSDATALFQCSDAGSGISTCPDPVEFGEGTAQSKTVTATDNAGNTASYTVSNINVDETDPRLTGTPTTAPNANGWYDGDVSINWTCSDSGGSGIAGSCPANDTITGEGEGLTATENVSDVAGNVTV